jgi:hypothetical protein
MLISAARARQGAMLATAPAGAPWPATPKGGLRMFPSIDDPQLHARLRRLDADLDQALAAASARWWEGTLAAEAPAASYAGESDGEGGARQAVAAVRRQLMDLQRALRYPPRRRRRPATLADVPTILARRRAP